MRITSPPIVGKATRFLHHASWNTFILLLATVILLVHTTIVQHTTDDLFISLRYSHNIASGHGPVFNVGDEVEGYTSPLWVFLLGGLAWLGLPLEPTAQALSLLSALIALWTLPRLARTWGWKGGSLAALLLAFNTSFAVWSGGAMEMTLFAALLLLALWSLGAERWLMSGTLFGLAILTRPMGALWLAITVLWLVGMFSRGGKAKMGRAVGGVMGGALLWVLPHELWRLAYYGQPFPNTFYNKVQLSPDRLRRGLSYVAEAASDYRLTLSPLLVGAFLSPVASWWQRRDALFLALIAGQLAYVILIGGDWMVGHRFLVPTVPLITLVGARWIVHLWGRVAPHSTRGAVLAGTAGIVVILVINLLVAVRLSNALHNDWFFIQRGVSESELMAETLERHCTPKTTVALFAVGSFSFAAIEYEIVDMFGLVTPAVTHAPSSAAGGVMPGHEHFNADVVRRLQPDLFVFHPEFDAVPIVDEKGWREGGLAHLIRQFTDDPAFWREHSTHSIEMPGGKYWNFVARHDVPCVWE